MLSTDKVVALIGVLALIVLGTFNRLFGAIL